MTMSVTMALRSLDELEPEDKPVSGGKAYNCARLRQAGFPVPDGVVIPTAIADGDLPGLSTHRWFLQFPADTLFAVRSSGLEEDGDAQSFAGVHETLLNVARAGLVEAVLACRASATSDRALAYRASRGLSTEPAQIAVLVQLMIQPNAAGVAFTVNPLTGSSDELVINASTGVGEDLVSGLVDPDEFIVRRRDRAIVATRIGSKNGDSSATPSLDTPRVQALAGLAIAIEREWGAPQDIEWCFDGSGFWIVQTRPVTTLRQAAAHDTEWTRANLAEVLPELTSPQALAATMELLNLAERRHMGRLLAPEEELGPMFKAFYGRLYLNLSQLRRVCMMGRTPAAAALRSLGHAGEMRPEDEQIRKAPIGAQLKCLPDFVRLLRRHANADRLARDHEAKTRDRAARLTSFDPNTLTDEQIWSHVEEWLREAPATIEAILVFGGVLFHEVPLRKMCEQAGFPFERLLFSQLAVGERSVSAQQAFDLVEIAEAARRESIVVRWFSDGSFSPSAMRRDLAGTVFLASFERFLERYGHRGVHESDWALPRYWEDPTPLLQAIRSHLQSPADSSVADRAARQEQEALEVWREFERRLNWLERWTLLPRVKSKVRRIKQYYVWRERCRSDMVRIVAAVRRLHLELARRFTERAWIERPADYFLVTLEEVGSAIRDGTGGRLKRIAAERTAELERFGTIQMPLLMHEPDLNRLIAAAGKDVAPDTDGEIHGLPVSTGSVEAEVVVIDSPHDFGRMKRGAILVTRATDPSWTPLFTLASGVIVEVGGVLSHASTIAREFGLPALANVKNATKRLRTGERVTLNATEGVIVRTKN